MLLNLVDKNKIMMIVLQDRDKLVKAVICTIRIYKVIR